MLQNCYKNLFYPEFGFESVTLMGNIKETVLICFELL